MLVLAINITEHFLFIAISRKVVAVTMTKGIMGSGSSQFTVFQRADS